MAEGPTPNAEQPGPKEIFSTANKKIALEARLILGGAALSPQKTDLAKVTSENLSEIKTETFSVVNHASTGERKDYWNNKGGSFDQQLQSWTTSLVGYMNDESFTAKEALAFYERYFSGEKTASNIDLFVGDRLNEYTKDGKIDFDGLNQDMPAIKKLANIFGGNSSELIESLISAQAKLTDQTKKQELISQVNEEKTIDQSPISRLNWLNEDEERLLTWLNQGAPEKTPVIPQSQSQTPREKTEPEIKPVKTTDPWTDIPKPQEPIKIQEGKVEKRAKGTTEHAEVKLILGTPQHPLITENKWSDGRIEKKRIRTPERSYHIPAVIYLDEDITTEQKDLINNTLSKVFEEVGVPKDKISNQLESGVKFIASVKRRKNGQVDSDIILHFVQNDPQQLEKPHHVVFFTNKDLCSQDTNFVVGAALPDLGTVISLKRVSEGIKDVNLRNHVIKTEIAHEVGHVYNLPSERRGKKNIEQSLGGHCKNAGCCMKQGLRVPSDFITITQNRIRNLGENRFFCDDCHQDLTEKFKKKN